MDDRPDVPVIEVVHTLVCQACCAGWEVRGDPPADDPSMHCRWCGKLGEEREHHYAHKLAG